MKRYRLTALGLLFWIGAAGCSGQNAANTSPNEVHLPSAQPAAAGPEGGAAQPAAPNAPPAWTMDLAKTPFPNRPAAGKVHGNDFVPNQVKWEGDGSIVFRTGKDFFADQEIKVLLFQSEMDLAKGRTLDVRPGSRADGLMPQIHLAWKDAGKPFAMDEIIMDKYALKLELGNPTGSKVPGKIYLCLPDQAHSFLAGTFTLEVPSLTGLKIAGTITLNPATAKGDLAIGYQGAATSGEAKSGWVGMNLSPEFGSGEVTSANSHLTMADNKTITYRHAGISPGTYLVYVMWNKHFYEGKWVEARDQKDLTLDVTVDPKRMGALEVKVPAADKERSIALLPLDENGKLPLANVNPRNFSFDLALFVEGLLVKVKPGETKAVFTEVAGGHYRVVDNATTVDAVVKPGETAKAELPAKP